MIRSPLMIALTMMVLGCGSNDSTTGSPKPTDTTSGAQNGGDGSGANSSVPNSAVIEQLLKGSDPKRFDLIAKCNVVVTVMRGSSIGMDNEPDVKESLERLVAVVQQYDSTVANALAKDPQAAADWCKAAGMAN